MVGVVAGEDDEVDAHLRAAPEDAESLLRERRAAVRMCAWCDAVFVEGAWYGASSLLTATWRVDRRVSHTICPACFERVLPGVPYPGP